MKLHETACPKNHWILLGKGVCMHVYFGRGGKAVLKMTPLLRGLDSEDLGTSKYPKGAGGLHEIIP